MKKVISLVVSILICVSIIGVFCLKSNDSKTNLNINKNQEEVAQDYTDEELEEGLDYPEYEQIQKVIEEKQKAIEKINSEKLTVEKEFASECNHNYVRITVPLDNVEFLPLKEMCTKCGGSQIIDYVKNDYEEQDFQEVINELVNDMNNN